MPTYVDTSRGTPVYTTVPRRRRLSRKPRRVVEEDGAFALPGRMVFDPDTMAIRPVAKPRVRAAPRVGGDAADRRTTDPIHRRIVAETTAAARNRVRTRVEPPQKSSGGLFGSVVDAFQDGVDRAVEHAVKPAGRIARRTVKAAGDMPLVALGSGASPRKAAPKLPTAAGELSGVSSVRRIRKGKGTLADWLVVGGIAAGPVARSASLSLRSSPKFGILSNDAIGNVRRRGYSGVALKRHIDLEPDKMIDARTGARPLPRRGQVEPGGVYRVRRPESDDYYSDWHTDEMLGNRIPWLVDDANNQVFVGEPGMEHANIYEALAERGVLRESGSLGQGYLYSPRWGAGERYPSSLVAGTKSSSAGANDALRRWLQYLTRNLDIVDDDVELSGGQFWGDDINHVSPNEEDILRALGISP